MNCIASALSSLTLPLYPPLPSPQELRIWRVENEWIGTSARRFFPCRKAAADGTYPLKPVDGKVTGWLPAEGEDCALWHFVMEDGDDEELEEEELRTAAEAYASGRTEPLSVGTAAAEEEEEEEEKGRRVAASGPRLWSTGEARERFLQALRHPGSCAAVSVAAHALRVHQAAFGLRANKITPERELELESYYHAAAFEEVAKGKKRARSSKW